jgi:hypothetical protein
MHGRGVVNYSNGDVYEGEFKNGLRHGRGILKCVDGLEFDGYWKEGKFQN